MGNALDEILLNALADPPEADDTKFCVQLDEGRWRLSEEGKSLFFRCAAQAIDALHLRRFELITDVVPYDTDDTQAHAWVLFGGAASSVVKLVLCEEWHHLKPTRYSIKAVAWHEALHILFHTMLQEAGGWDGKSDATRRAEHEVINILVRLLAGRFDG